MIVERDGSAGGRLRSRIFSIPLFQRSKLRELLDDHGLEIVPDTCASLRPGSRLVCCGLRNKPNTADPLPLMRAGSAPHFSSRFFKAASCGNCSNTTGSKSF